MKYNCLFVLLIFLLIGCGTGDEAQHEKRRKFELTHNMNIIRIRHFDYETNYLLVMFSYHSPAYYYIKHSNDSIQFIWKIVDIRDSVIFLPDYMTDFKRFNRIDNPTEYPAVMQEAIQYYKQQK